MHKSDSFHVLIILILGKIFAHNMKRRLAKKYYFLYILGVSLEICICVQ
jgi:hypothetical protein